MWASTFEQLPQPIEPQLYWSEKILAAERRLEIAREELAKLALINQLEFEL